MDSEEEVKLPDTKRPLRKFQLKERVTNNKTDHKEKARQKNERKYNNEGQ